jgi:two-component system, OmpR family, response regulator VicR
VVVLLSQERILVVDDEKEIADLLKDYLGAEGFQVLTASDGEEALKIYREFAPDLAILDIMLPRIDGMELCRMIRNDSPIPIIMLSARKSDMDKILGLGLGADDYVTKPFSPSELAARIKAQLRRYNQLAKLMLQEEKTEKINFNGLELDLKGYSVSLNNIKIELSGKEFEVLKLLTLHANQVLTKEQIYNKIWGYDDYGDINTVTVHIRKLREKLEKDPSNPQFIKTVWGVGYKFEVEKQ